MFCVNDVCLQITVDYQCVHEDVWRDVNGLILILRLLRITELDKDGCNLCLMLCDIKDQTELHKV